jgi:hypothetical protein
MEFPHPRTFLRFDSFTTHLVLVIFEYPFWVGKGKITKFKNETMNLHTHNAANVGLSCLLCCEFVCKFPWLPLEFGFFQDENE